VTHQKQVYGGKIERFDDYLAQETATPQRKLKPETIRHLINTYGAAYPEVLRYLDDARLCAGDAISHSSPVLRAEVLFGIREEMAQKLTDVVLRRTELGSAGHPGIDPAVACAEIMSAELGWNEARVKKEVEELKMVYQPVA